jgi:hypothetical protein
MYTRPRCISELDQAMVQSELRLPILEAPSPALRHIKTYFPVGDSPPSPVQPTGRSGATSCSILLKVIMGIYPDGAETRAA